MLAHQIRRALAIALVFQVAWLVTGLIFMLVDAPVLWVLLIANLFTLWVPALFILVTRSSLPESFQIGFAVFITSSSLLGSSLDVYGAFLSWDTIVHVYSGVLLAWFGFILVGKVRVPKGVSLPLWFKNTVAFMTPLAFAATTYLEPQCKQEGSKIRLSIWPRL